jgi:hypothetical protein
MENITIHEFMTSRTKKIGYQETKTFWTAHYVAITAGVELPESVKNDRWFKVLAPFITRVELWECQSDMHLPEYPKTRDWAANRFPDRTYVVHTQYGTATIVMFASGSAISGITFKNNRSAKRFNQHLKSMTLGTWRKYGGKRGHGMQQLRAMFGMKLCTSPESGRDICEFEAVCRLTRPGYEAQDHKATQALYAVVEAADKAHEALVQELLAKHQAEARVA